MLRDKFIKAALILIVLLLCLNLLKGNFTSPLLYIEAQAKLGDNELQMIDLSHISGIICSADGQIVYVTGYFDDKKEGMLNRECILRSRAYGNPGSWQIVAKQKINNF